MNDRLFGLEERHLHLDSGVADMKPHNDIHRSGALQGVQSSLCGVALKRISSRTMRLIRTDIHGWVRCHSAQPFCLIAMQETRCEAKGNDETVIDGV